jgi:zinc protease
MQNSNFDPRQVERERTVIISERQGHENEPTFRLAEELQAAAFRVHGYHHETIGDMADLETISRDDLYNHYRRHYVPSNAVLAVVGDFSVRPMLDRIRGLFGDIPKAPKPEVFVRPEPIQSGERKVTVEGPGDTSYLFIAYHVPPAAHPDFFVLTVLGSVLVGAASMNFFSGGISNKTSRLYRALVEGEIAAAVRGGLAATIDPYLYSINVTMRPDRDPEEALERIDREIEDVLERALDPKELEKANKQARALFAYSSESITNQGFWLGFTEMFADQAWFDNYLARLEAVTIEDVHAAAQRYLRPANRVVGMYRPVKGSKHG